ncbi:hypothetical protein ACP4OV_022348 [Aristida adscensionis]
MPLEHFFLALLLVLCNLVAAIAAAERTPNATTPPPPPAASPSSCPSYRCGHAVDIRYPFWIDDTSAGGDASASHHCGYPSLRLECRRGTPVLALPSGEYAVTHVLYGDRTVSLLDLGVFSLSNTCPLVGRNLTLPAASPLSLTARDANLTFFLHCTFMGIPAHLVACLEGDGRHHSYVFRDGDELTPYGYAGLCQDVVGVPVLRRSLLGAAAGAGGPLDAVVPALSMGFELSWRPEAAGECGRCERAGGLCGRRRRAANEAWAFACFRATATSSWIASRFSDACGNLTIAYPFWLAGAHSPECGFQPFQVACDGGGAASLKNSIWTYQILDISYPNSSFRVTNADLSDGACDIELHVNASSDLGLAPFRISPRNQELFFIYNCDPRERRRLPPSWAPVNCAADESRSSFAWLAGAYRPDDIWMPLPGNCTVSMMPVLGYDGAAAADYRRLMKGGFLLEYAVPDCNDCTASGGRCRVDTSDDLFGCHCADDVYPVTCGYPFWLRGRHPPYCGHPSFGVACDLSGAAAPRSLNDSYLRVLGIHYGNRSVVAFHANLAAAGACRATYFNTSTSLALSLLAVSRANWELFLWANCSRPPAPAPAGSPSLRMDCPGSGAWHVSLGRAYDPEAAGVEEAAAGCHFSVVPVLPGSEMRALGDYAGLVRRGFLLEWAVPGDCPACSATGGECRYDAGVNAFRCLCPDGRLRPATCASDCEPATCGNVTISYPFWLGGGNQTSSPCGHPAFQVWCDRGGAAGAGVASLRGSAIHVRRIDYGDSSFLAYHTRVAGGDVCRADFNMSSSIALSPFTVSPRNRALCFLYNCSGAAPPPERGLVSAACPGGEVFVYLGRSYHWDSPPAIAAGRCTYTYFPVLGSEAAAAGTTAANSSRLLRDGFVLKWDAAGVGDCAACNATGGQCRYDVDAAALACLCPDGRLHGSTCAVVKVVCTNHTPYLGFYQGKYGLQILDIFYDNGSLIIADVHKLQDFSSSAPKGCHAPTNNSTTKLGYPFLISPLNQNLIFYNCSKAPAAPAAERLVPTACRNNTFVRVAERRDESGGYGSYFLEGCDATVVPVLGKHGEANASRYLELISDGFLLT